MITFLTCFFLSQQPQHNFWVRPFAEKAKILTLTQYGPQYF